jgi:hypothetical protein
MNTRERSHQGFVLHIAAFGDIAKHGETYRDIEPRDRVAPSDLVARAILAKRSHFVRVRVRHRHPCLSPGTPNAVVTGTYHWVCEETFRLRGMG